jgi:16S rRNA C967 or C1407 C5-methylase (RsmB/RsmF family)
MSRRRNLHQAKQEFLDYYLPLLPQFSSPRELEAFLTRRNPQVLLISPLNEEKIHHLWIKNHLDWTPVPWFPHTLNWPQNVPPGTSLPGFSEGWLYALNPASLLPILALNPKPSDIILDASAAPGGKTLAIINFLHPHIPDILANDVSLPRFKRLRTTLKFYGYPQIPVLCSPIQSLPYKLQPHFTKILLDAPCSSEKHVFNSKNYLKIWSPNRSLTLSHLQLLLINSLIPLLAPHGQLIYSTCSISPRENQLVIDEALKRYPDLVQTPPLTPQFSTANFDPMFVAALSS